MILNNNSVLFFIITFMSFLNCPGYGMEDQKEEKFHKAGVQISQKQIEPLKEDEAPVGRIVSLGDTFTIQTITTILPLYFKMFKTYGIEYPVDTEGKFVYRTKKIYNNPDLMGKAIKILATYLYNISDRNSNEYNKHLTEKIEARGNGGVGFILLDLLNFSLLINDSVERNTKHPLIYLHEDLASEIIAQLHNEYVKSGLNEDALFFHVKYAEGALILSTPNLVINGENMRERAYYIVLGKSCKKEFVDLCMNSPLFKKVRY